MSDDTRVGSAAELQAAAGRLRERIQQLGDETSGLAARLARLEAKLATLDDDAPVSTLAAPPASPPRTDALERLARDLGRWLSPAPLASDPAPTAELGQSNRSASVISEAKGRFGPQSQSARFVWLALGCGLAGQAALTFNLSLPLGAALLLVGLALAGYAALRVPDIPAVKPLNRLTIVGLLALFGISLAIRLYRNVDFPPSLFYDEAYNGLEAIHITSLPGFQVWSDALSGRPTFHLYLLNLAFRLFGVSVPTLRGVSAFGGALTVVFAFLASREIIGDRGAWLAGAILAASRWDMTFSRIAYEAIWAAVFATATVWLLAGGVRRGRALWLILAAIPCALGLYTYVSYRLFGVAIAIFWLQLLWQQRRRAVASAVGFGAVGLLVAAPLLAFARQNPDKLLFRFSQVSIFQDVQAQHSFKPLLDSISLYVGIFNYRGGIGARHNLPLTAPNLPGTPELGLPFAVCFALGLGIVLVRWKRPANVLLFTTLLMGLTAGALTILIESPHPTRSILAAPITAICAAYFLELLLVSMPTKLPSARALQAGVAIGACAAIAVVELVTYYRQGTFVAAYHEFQHDLADEGFYLQGRLGHDAIYISEPLRGFPADTIVDFLNYPNQVEKLPLYNPATTVPAPDQGHAVEYVLTEGMARIGIPYLQQLYPAGVAVLHRNPVGEGEFATFDVSADAIGKSHGLTAEFVAAGQHVTRLESTVDSSANPPPVGAPYDVTWQGTVVVAAWGTYRFDLGPNLGPTVLVDGVDATGATGVPLAIGPHALIVRAHVDTGGPYALRWAKAGQQPVPLPSSALFSVATPSYGMVARYFHTVADPQPETIERVPGLDVIPPEDGFQHVIWRGNLSTPVPGVYRFWLAADDYGTVGIDGRQIITTERRPPGEFIAGQVTLTAGTHAIEVQLFNVEGGYLLGLDWQPPNGPREALPPASVRPLQGGF